ncbi:MAG: DUF3365 domain-containing protein [Draconibacterium sp.]|nr:DUF3365 domain-containing protein [Draconibacterium sp.]
MRWQILISIFSVVIIFSCNSKIDSEKYSEVQNKGNEISNITQTILLANVGKAIKKGGPEYAIEFCNLKASSIADSLNLVNNCTISRHSAKNRNAGNMLNGEIEKNLWEVFEKANANDTVIRSRGKLIFYKPIKIVSPACLKCHGNPESDINSATFSKIQKLYPNDLATGYKMNDLRGVWKIEFEQ